MRRALLGGFGVLLLGLLVLGACGPGEALPGCGTGAPLITVAPGDRVPGYLVVFQESVQPRDVDAIVFRLQTKLGFTATQIYRDSIRGFVADLSAAQLDALRCEPVVKEVQENSVAAALRDR